MQSRLIIMALRIVHVAFELLKNERSSVQDLLASSGEAAVCNHLLQIVHPHAIRLCNSSTTSSITINILSHCFLLSSFFLFNFTHISLIPITCCILGCYNK